VSLTMKASRKQQGGVWPLACSLLSGQQDLVPRWGSIESELQHSVMGRRKDQKI
jgi:hypothetical protein